MLNQRSVLTVIIWACLLFYAFVGVSLSQLSHPPVKEETLSDGVEHWYVVPPQKHGSYFWQLLQELCAVTVSKKPFGKSIAFLAGVGTYHHLSPQLDKSVPNDLKEMRDLLLNDMGFDEVYVAKDDVVNRDLIEGYIKERISNLANEEDRLLFYYSGHGAENHGDGYLLFGNAERGKFYGPQVLPVSALLDWSKELKFQHVLFILDSCASGLTFTSKSPEDDRMIETLSGNGSRTVAGTAEELAYELDARQQVGNGAFTYALLTAFHSVDLSGTTLITVADLYARVEQEMARFRIQNRVTTHPHISRLDESEYRGTFVFLNARSTRPHLTTAEFQALGAVRVSKEEWQALNEDSARPNLELVS
jgi:hypothetical protein